MRLANHFPPMARLLAFRYESWGRGMSSVDGRNHPNVRSREFRDAPPLSTTKAAYSPLSHRVCGSGCAEHDRDMVGQSDRGGRRGLRAPARSSASARTRLSAWRIQNRMASIQSGSPARKTDITASTRDNPASPRITTVDLSAAAALVFWQVSELAGARSLILGPDLPLGFQAWRLAPMPLLNLPVVNILPPNRRRTLRADPQLRLTPPTLEAIGGASTLGTQSGIQPTEAPARPSPSPRSGR